MPDPQPQQPPDPQAAWQNAQSISSGDPNAARTAEPQDAWRGAQAIGAKPPSISLFEMMNAPEPWSNLAHTFARGVYEDLRDHPFQTIMTLGGLYGDEAALPLKFGKFAELRQWMKENPDVASMAVRHQKAPGDVTYDPETASLNQAPAGQLWKRFTDMLSGVKSQAEAQALKTPEEFKPTGHAIPPAPKMPDTPSGGVTYIPKELREQRGIPGGQKYTWIKFDQPLAGQPMQRDPALTQAREQQQASGQYMSRADAGRALAADRSNAGRSALGGSRLSMSKLYSKGFNATPAEREQMAVQLAQADVTQAERFRRTMNISDARWQELRDKFGGTGPVEPYQMQSTKQEQLRPESRIVQPVKSVSPRKEAQPWIVAPGRRGQKSQK